MWDKRHNISIMGITEGEEKRKEQKKYMNNNVAEIFQNQWQTPGSTENTKQVKYLHLSISNCRKPKTKRKSWKKPGQWAWVGTHLTYRGTRLRITSDVSSETIQARRDLSQIFKVLKEKTCHPRILYPVKLSFKFEGKINWGHLSPVDLPCKKYFKKFFREKENSDLHKERALERE